MEGEKNIVNEEQKKEVTEKKKGNGSTIIILLLVLACVGLGGYVVYDKVLSPKTSKTEEKEKGNSSEEEKEETKSNDEKEETFTDSELEKYVNYISPTTIGISPLFNIDKLTAGNLSFEEKMKYIGGYVYDQATTSSDAHYSIISEEKVKKSIEEIYGPNTYERKTFNLGCKDFKYNEDGNYYSETGCGGTSATFYDNIVIGYSGTKDKLEITTAYAIYDGSTQKIYKDYDLKNAVEDYKGGSTQEIKSYLENFIKSNKDKLSHLKYTFESTDGIHYYFKELTNIK